MALIFAEAENQKPVKRIPKRSSQIARESGCSIIRRTKKSESLHVCTILWK